MPSHQQGVNHRLTKNFDLNNESGAALEARLHYMDNIRAIALVAGVILHSGLAYSVVTQAVWPFADRSSSWALDYWIWPLHTFRMPLFFLIAGFFAHLLIQRRGVKAFIKHRILRIVLPFVIFLPLLTACFIAIFILAATHMEVQNPVIDHVRLKLDPAQAPETAVSEPADSTLSDNTSDSITSAHLWFLYYLIFFCAAAALLNGRLQRLANYLPKLLSPLGLLLALPLVTAVALWGQYSPHPAPEQFMPKLWALGFYGPFFLTGWVCFAKSDGLMQAYQYWKFMASVSLIAIVGFVTHLPEPMTLQQALVLHEVGVDKDLAHGVRVTCTAILSWYLTFLSLLVGYRFLNSPNRISRFISDGSYWVYIIHLPVVFYLQAIFNTQYYPIWVEFFVIAGATLAFGYLTYLVLVRPTPIGWLLNGRRTKAEQRA